MRLTRAAAWVAVACVPAALLLVGAAAPEKEPAPRTVKVVDVLVQGDLEEARSFENPFGPRGHLLRDYTASLRKAAKDDQVKGVLLRLNQPSIGLGKLQELRDALDEVRAAKKRVYCYLEACGNTDYLLACSADRICAAPGGMVLLTGLRAQVTFFKGLLDWAGVKADFLHFGKHKSAAEPLTSDSMSEENRQVLNEVLDDLYGQFVGTIAKGRNLPEQKVREAIDFGPYCAKDARIHHLVDDVAYLDQFLEAIGKELGGKVELVKDYHNLGKKGPDLSEFNIFTFFAALKPKPDIPETDRPKIVILYATGMILMGESPLFAGNVVTAEEMAKAFRQIRENPTVRAVVLRIDSPGGSALVSDLIWHEVERTRKAGKPVVASMSDVAASGGYYIAMGADAIVAEPATLTGSIGVVGGKLVLRGLYDKIGLKKETFSRGQNAGLFSDYTPFSEAERKRVSALMSDIYNDFVHKAALGRNIPHEKMQELATGRVWTGRAAKAIGLVDSLGGLKEAFELAAEKAGLKGKDVQPVILPREKNFLEVLLSPSATIDLSDLGLRISISNRQPVIGNIPQVLAALMRENVLALMPYIIEVR